MNVHRFIESKKQKNKKKTEEGKMESSIISSQLEKNVLLDMWRFDYIWKSIKIDCFLLQVAPAVTLIFRMNTKEEEEEKKKEGEERGGRKRRRTRNWMKGKKRDSNNKWRDGGGSGRCGCLHLGLSLMLYRTACLKNAPAASRFHLSFSILFFTFIFIHF